MHRVCFACYAEGRRRKGTALTDELGAHVDEDVDAGPSTVLRSRGVLESKCDVSRKQISLVVKNAPKRPLFREVKPCAATLRRRG